MKENQGLITSLLTHDNELSPLAKYFFAAKGLIATFKDFHLNKKYNFIGGDWWPSGPQSRPQIHFKRLKISTWKAKGLEADGTKKH